MNLDLFYSREAFFFIDFDDSHGKLAAEAGAAAGSGIEPEAAVDFLQKVFMAVPENNNVDSLEVSVDILFIMGHKKMYAANLKTKGVFKAGSPISVIIAANNINAAHFAKLI